MLAGSFYCLVFDCWIRSVCSSFGWWLSFIIIFFITSILFFKNFIICSVSIGYDCVIQPSHVSLVHFLYACIKSFDSFRLHSGLFFSFTAPFWTLFQFHGSMIPGFPAILRFNGPSFTFHCGFFMILSQVIEYQLDKILYDFSRIV